MIHGDFDPDGLVVGNIVLLLTGGEGIALSIVVAVHLPGDVIVKNISWWPQNIDGVYFSRFILAF